MKRYFKWAAVIAVFVAAAAVVFMHRDAETGPVYVSSEKCKGCHGLHYDGWKETLHPRQFRPVSSPDDILGDFGSGDGVLTFRKEDVEYVIGNKWEQVYARKIDGEYYQLPAKWYILKRQWVPIKDWDTTPMSRKCNGCHTTGFDAATLEFKEFGIGCEACHGPGSLHARNRRKEASAVCSICHRGQGKDKPDIISSINSEVCGQCHNRGSSTGGGEGASEHFSFPVGYVPGEDVGGYLRQLGPKDDADGRFWWGNGVAKNRHQEFADWQNSKHSRSLKLMKDNHTDDRGELRDECLRCHSADYRLAKTGKRPDLDTARYGITCVVCHEPHGLDRRFTFARDGSSVCGGCHADSMSLKAAASGMKHYPCPPGMVTCADCHMPYTVKSGGEFSLRSHSFRIVPPEHTAEFGIPNSCINGGCHRDRPLEWAQREFNQFYPEKARKRIRESYEKTPPL